MTSVSDRTPGTMLTASTPGSRSASAATEQHLRCLDHARADQTKMMARHQRPCRRGRSTSGSSSGRFSTPSRPSSRSVARPVLGARSAGGAGGSSCSISPGSVIDANRTIGRRRARPAHAFSSFASSRRRSRTQARAAASSSSDGRAVASQLPSWKRAALLPRPEDPRGRPRPRHRWRALLARPAAPPA
jgi:hypothetical protein